MKNIKNLLGLLTIALIVFNCTDDYSEAINVQQTAGLIINIDDTTGQILGTPAPGVDLENAEIAFSSVSLEFDARLESGTENTVSKYEIVKTFNGEEETVVAEVSALPYNIDYTTIQEFISGFSIQASDIRIGDEFTFKVKLYKTDGSVLYFGSSIASYTIIVNCASTLAGMYQVTTVRDDGSTYNQGIEEIVEVSAGYYKTVTTGGWAAGAIAPDQGYNFQDTCNTLTVPNQDLCQGFYSNDVTGPTEGSVTANGDLIISYTIDFSAGARDYTSTYVRQ